MLDPEFGKTCPINGVYQLLERHGFVCLEPRPKPPPQNPADRRPPERPQVDLGFAAVEPATGWSLAMPFRDVNTATIQAFLDAAASKLRRREHAVMILDGAG